jgi:hypothetical protein
MYGFVFAGAVIGDNVIAVICAVQALRGKHIARHSDSTGRQRKAGKPIGRPNGEGDSKKMASGKKPWMMRVQHLGVLVVAFL